MVSRLLEIAGSATILLIGGALFLLFRWVAKRKSQRTQAAQRMPKPRDAPRASEMEDGATFVLLREALGRRLARVRQRERKTNDLSIHWRCGERPHAHKTEHGAPETSEAEPGATG